MYQLEVWSIDVLNSMCSLALVFKD